MSTLRLILAAILLGLAVGLFVDSMRIPFELLQPRPGGSRGAR